MPNIKSAKKRVIVNTKKTEQNKNIRSKVKSEIKKYESLIVSGNYEEAKALLPNVFKLIDSACSKKIYHKNNAANKKAKLSKKLSDVLAAEPKKVEEVKAVEEVKTEEVAPEKEVKAEVKPARKPRAKKTAAAE